MVGDGYGTVSAPSKGETKPARSCWPSTPDLPLYLLLLLLFSVSMYTVGLLCTHIAPTMAVIWALCVSMAILITSLGRGWPWAIFGSLAIFLVLLGFGLGWLCRLTWPVVVEDHYVGPSRGAALFCGLAVLILLIHAMVLGYVLPRLGFRLLGSSARFAEEHGWGWHPEMVSQMDCGFRCTEKGIVLEGKEVPKTTVLRNLVEHSAYWSGEPAYDYVFHLANENTFLGPFLCHPDSPFDKLERVIVMAIIIPLILFPVAAFSTLMSKQSGVLRTLLQLVLITFPRNRLKAYLNKCVVADDEIVLQHKRGALLWRSKTKKLVMHDSSDCLMEAAQESVQIKRAQGYEVIFLTICVLVTIIISIACAIFIKGRKKSLAVALAGSADGLAFASVLELLLGVLMPSCDKDGHWSVGFFGRWWSERQHHMRFVEPNSEASKDVQFRDGGKATGGDEATEVEEATQATDPEAGEQQGPASMTPDAEPDSDDVPEAATTEPDPVGTQKS